MKTLQRRRAAVRQQRLAGADHVRRVDVVADHLQREIGLHRRADVEGAAVEQRPAAVLALDAAQVDADLALQLQVVRLAEIVAQQHVFGRDGGVGLQLEHPVAVRPAGGAAGRRVARVDGARRAPDGRRRGAGESMRAASSIGALYHGALRPSARSAAVKPERTAPSMVAGRPVSVQSPARTRLRQRGARARAAGVLLGRGGEGGAALLDDLPGRQLGAAGRRRVATSAQKRRGQAPRGPRRPGVGAADGHRDAGRRRRRSTRAVAADHARASAARPAAGRS